MVFRWEMDWSSFTHMHCTLTKMTESLGSAGLPHRSLHMISLTRRLQKVNRLLLPVVELCVNGIM